jgi:peptidoglycan-N-acetylglucosamine deacetylase
MLRRAILWFNLIAPVAAIVVIWLGHSWLWALGIVAVGHALWLWATLVPACGWWGPVMSRLPTTDRKVWITIDDGPSPDDTPALLDLLEQHGAKATFFLIGAKVERYPQLVRDIVGRGHEVANHTYHHPAAWFWFYGRGGTYREISKGAGILKRIVPQVTPRWFRAPVGAKNHHVHSILKEQGLQLVAWSAGGLDRVSKDKKKILEQLDKGIEPGAIILMHEGGMDDSGEPLAPQILAGLLEKLKAGGYQAVLPEGGG